MVLFALHELEGDEIRKVLSVAVVLNLKSAVWHLVVLTYLISLNLPAIIHSLGGISQAEHRGKISVLTQGLLCVLVFYPCI